MSKLSGRNAAFAALMLLRCRDRVERILATLPESRRNAVTQALSEFESLSEQNLKRALAAAVEREDAVLDEFIRRQLGAGAANASRGIRRFVARAEWP
ncbi:MAG TPA: hypothetical protein VH477_09385 [Bryobacteraceae bacterium]